MAKYFEVDFRKGSFNDQTGQRTVTLTGTPSLKLGSKGQNVQSDNSNYLTYSSQILPNNAFTVVMYYKLKTNDKTNLKGHCTITDGTLGVYSIFSTNGNPIIYFHANNYQYFTATPDYNWHCIIFTMPGSAKADIASSNCYLDGVLLAKGTGSSSSSPTTPRSSYTRLTGSISSTGVSNMSYVGVYDHVFTEQERASAYKDFLNSYPVIQEKYPQVGIVNKPLDLSREKNNTIGTEMVNQSSWYTLAYWDNTADANWSQVGNTLVSNGVTGYLKRNSFYTIGKTYQIRVTASVTSGTLRISDGASDTVCDVTTSGTFVFSFTCTNVVLSIRSVTFNGSFSLFSIMETTGLVAAYNMIPVGGTLVDISGNSKNSTLSGNPISIKEGLKFDGINDSASIGNIGNINTITFKIRPYSTTCKILQGIVGSNLVHINSGTLTASDFANKYVNGVSSSTMVANLWQTVILTSVSSVAFTAVTLGLNSSTYGKFDIEDLRFYNRVLSTTEIKNYHNSFVNPTLKVDFSDEGADGIAKVPSGWTKSSGSFKVVEWQRGNVTQPTGWTNSGTNPYETFTSSGLSISSAINTTDLGICYTNVLAFVAGKRYRIKHNFVLNSGIYPNLIVATNTALSVGVQVSTSANTSYIDFSCITSTNYYVGYRVETGIATNFSLTGFAIEEIPPLPTFTNGTKYLECVTAGIISLFSKQVYGTWEFDWYKGGEGNDMFISLISAPDNIITFRPYSDEAIYLRINGGGGFQTVSSYFTINTWYRVKVTKSLSNVIYVYIKGGDFGNTTWTEVNHCIDTIPITNSNKLIFDLDAGDRVANLVFYDGIKQ